MNSPSTLRTPKEYPKSQILRLTGRDWAAILLTSIYILLFTHLSLSRHNRLATQMNDLGNMVQSIWSVSQGDLTMRVTNTPDGNIQSRIGVHANIIFYVIAVPFGFAPQMLHHLEYTLLALASVACGLSGLGIYFYTRRLLENESTALLIASAFWLNPMVHDANLYDFHVTTLISAFLVWMLYCWQFGKERLGWLFFSLAIISKEDVAPILAAIGVSFYFTRWRNRGKQILLISFLYMVIIFGIVIPMANFGNPVPSIAASRFSWMGNGPSEYVTTILTKPGLVFSQVFSYDHLRLPIYLLLFGGMIALCGRATLLLAVAPPVAIAMLTGNSWMTRPTGTYYWVPVISLIYLACAEVLHKQRSNADFQIAVKFYLPALSLIVSLILSQSPLGLYSSFEDFKPREEEAIALNEIKSIIPASAPVSAQNNLGAHFAKRGMIAIFPAHLDQAEFVVLRLKYRCGPDATLFPSYSQRHIFRVRPSDYWDSVNGALGTNSWMIVYQKFGFIVFAKQDRDQRFDLSSEHKSEFIQSFNCGRPTETQKSLYNVLGY